MADRYFKNDMPDFVAEMPADTGVTQGEGEVVAQGTQESLTRLLSMPYHSFSERLKRAALDLKETVVTETWGLSRQNVQDFSLYTGTLGTAYLLFKSYQVTNNRSDLDLSFQIVKACDSASSHSEHVTFFGRAGVCALGAVMSKYMADNKMLDYYLTKFKEIELPKDLSDELFHGRAGYLWTCLYLNKHIGEDTIPSAPMSVVADEIIANGRKMGSKDRCPLMYEFRGQKFWGTAHGLAGIMHVLMDLELKPDEREDVKATLKYMVNNRLPSGNYPAAEDDKNDVLVQWCRGAPGIALTLVKAAQVFEDKEFLEAAIGAAEVVWNRGLLRRVGICHGISGNAYVFLSLYQLTKNKEFLYRSKAFASYLLDRSHKLISSGEMHGGDAPYSLFEGLGGLAYLFLDMVQPTEAKFPAYEL
ncbi:Lanthionine synthetase C-like protein 1 [Heracleum sosnowskyi]|uniref:Lanthionine synthetase C-like protein 1 n=1 Tax=Heracleum sosnowskyi TaxID=360622 RepID=A0AAD8NDZ5_9APIA|nr:Lanthionine synthetase C-like protein 1 [Heracleum sosnowskyi]